ncbi:haloacid dehalogenase-like hydrolase [Carboxylicivirga sp. A043]|uniref:HAD family hydrolase n=1 Tax=Carboxylicivirga litoralis TaxID=2816963 RepID=UPI0021CAE410|nr:HAD family hydrolase [Carboxylicivirga sp. A043]MCU4154693.1 haloacid dehalogenase-like hydrolase [Carboxylicivirga sp. A043]
MNKLYLLLFLFLLACNPSQQEEKLVLPSWNDGVARSAIIEFVEKTSDKMHPDFIRIEDRIAVFDMDGTILLEKPNYVLFDFAIREMHKRMAENPALKEKQPFKAIADKDWDHFKNVSYFAPDGLFSVLLYATDGFTNEQYQNAVADYFETVKDERFGQSYRDLVYQPMLEMIEYLQDNEYEVYIVSGSDPQFTRSFCAEIIGIPVTNVIGSTVLTKFNEEVGASTLIRQHEFIQPINDEAGKPVNILNKIGKIPVVAIGNSKGDYHMLQYSKNSRVSLQMIVNHDDEVREYSYNNNEMKQLCVDKGWVEISMKDDFKVIF